MPIASVEGLIVTLLFVVPGGLGVEFRRFLYPAPKLTAFQEILYAFAASSSALIALEAFFGLVGLLTPLDIAMGDALIDPLMGSKGIPTLDRQWWLYLAFLSLALLLPGGFAWLRRTGLVRRMFGRVALYSAGFDHLFAEIWRPVGGKNAPWVVVETNDDRSLQGQVIWRSTAPHPPEVVLGQVYDVTDPENPRGGDGLVWVTSEIMRRLWLLPPEAEPADPT